MKLIIDINENVYNALTHTEFDANLVVNEMRKSIVYGIPIPDFEPQESDDWWNAPYQKGGKE